MLCCNLQLNCALSKRLEMAIKERMWGCFGTGIIIHLLIFPPLSFPFIGNESIICLQPLWAQNNYPFYLVNNWIVDDNSAAITTQLNDQLNLVLRWEINNRYLFVNYHLIYSSWQTWVIAIPFHWEKNWSECWACINGENNCLLHIIQPTHKPRVNSFQSPYPDYIANLSFHYILHMHDDDMGWKDNSSQTKVCWWR